MPATTHIIDWKTTANENKPPLTIETDPESIYTGDKITLRLYSAYSHLLFSPYGGLSAKSVSPKNEPITEIIELSGGNEITAKYPIDTVTTLIDVMPLVDETTHALIAAPIGQLFSVVNNKLKLNDETLKIHGSIKLVYRTFNAQMWTHTAFNTVGNALLFAQNEVTLDYENVTLRINERSNSASDNIRIEAWTSQPKHKFNPYHAVIIYPATKQFEVLADYGTVVFREKVTHTIKAEEITFSGTEANLQYPIKTLGKVSGIFFDKDLNRINPTFRLTNGVIKSSVECYGFAIVEYTTQGLVYDYNAQVTVIPPPTPSTTIRIGYIIAQIKGKNGIGASYKVPAWQTDSKTPIDFYTVTRKVLSQETGSFEYPPNWPSDDNTYPNQPTGNFPVIGDPTVVTNITVESGYVDISGSIDYDTHSNRFFDPYAGSMVNPDAVYELQESIPSEITDTYLIDQLTKAINAAKARWGIA